MLQQDSLQGQNTCDLQLVSSLCVWGTSPLGCCWKWAMAAGSRSLRTQRQQEQNKQAQQRYRERKKMKAEQLESQFSNMQQQMAELQRVLRHNVALQASWNQEPRGCMKHLNFKKHLGWGLQHGAKWYRSIHIVVFLHINLSDLCWGFDASFSQRCPLCTSCKLFSEGYATVFHWYSSSGTAAFELIKYCGNRQFF